MFLQILNWFLQPFKLIAVRHNSSPIVVDASINNPFSSASSTAKDVVKVDFKTGRRQIVPSIQPTDEDEARGSFTQLIIFSPDQHTRLNAITRSISAKDHQETIRCAFNALEGLVALRAQGNIVGFYDKDGKWVVIEIDPER
jgi:hypothetical protein